MRKIFTWYDIDNIIRYINQYRFFEGQKCRRRFLTDDYHHHHKHNDDDKVEIKKREIFMDMTLTLNIIIHYSHLLTKVFKMMIMIFRDIDFKKKCEHKKHSTTTTTTIKKTTNR